MTVAMTFISVALMLFACAVDKPTLAGIALGIGMAIFVI